MAVDGVDYRALVGESLNALIDGLSPFVARVLVTTSPPGFEWPDLLRAKDAASGRRVGEYRSRDLSLMLRAMTERLARGVETVSGGGRRQAVIDRHRDEIADALRASGFEVSTDVGLSEFRVDIVIFDPEQIDQPLVAVLLDGPEWFGRKTVADRDGLPVEVLENLMHWPAVERVWMPEWLNHRASTLARLGEAVSIAKQRRLHADVEPEPLSVISDPLPVSNPVKIEAVRSAPTFLEPRRVPALQQHPMIEEYREWTPRVSGDISVLGQLHRTWAKDQVGRVAQEVIETEAPVHRARLARLVASAFGLNPVNEERRRAIQRVVPPEFSRPNDQDFYWPEGVEPDSWRQVRSPKDGISRALDEVSLIEIGNAMTIVAEQAGGIGAEDLKREALALFGGRRMTQAIGARLDAALRQALDDGLLRASGSGVITSV